MRSVRVDRVTLLTKPELCKALKVSEWTIQSYLRKGIIPRPFTLVDDGELRWRASDIAGWLDDLQRHPRKSRLRGAVAKLASRKTLGRAVA